MKGGDAYDQNRIIKLDSWWEEDPHYVWAERAGSVHTWKTGAMCATLCE